jgi:sugar phosphate isomerase/epimerase
MDRIHRREFLKHGAALMAGAAGIAGVVGTTACASTSSARPAGDRRAAYKLALGQWSLHRALRAGTLDNLDFAPMARRDFGFDGVDYVNTFFKDRATDRAYLAEMRKRADDVGIVNVLILVDGEGAVGDPDPAKRQQAIDAHLRWVDAARSLGCRGIRINAVSQGSPDEQRRLVADGARRLAELAASRDIDILIENHGGLSSNGAWLASLIREVNHPRCGSLPDFGNWDMGGGTMYDRYEGVAELLPTAKAVSVKSHDFDAEGRETRTDYDRMLGLVRDTYRGEYLEIEYEGDRLGEAEGIRATKRLVERVLAAR